jgi:hypothetical protein
VVKNILESRGNAPRLYRNMLVFIAPDASNSEAWEHAIREYLAWKSIENETDSLNLDAQQRTSVANALKRTEETVISRLQETYSWLIVPVQPDPTGAIDYQAYRINGNDSFYERAIRKLRQNELLIQRWSPDNLLVELDHYLWNAQDHLHLKQLWDYLARYCYLPRLQNRDVLIEAIQDGVTRSDAPFGYATMLGADGNYKGVIFGESGSIYVDDNALIVRAEVATKQLEIIQQSYQPRQVNQSPNPSPERTVDRTPIDVHQPKVTTRYHGTVSLDPQRVNREMSTIVEEIIQHLTSLTGTDVEITLEISAERPSGFDDVTIRTIGENSRTLKFNSHGFEE